MNVPFSLLRLSMAIAVATGLNACVVDDLAEPTRLETADAVVRKLMDAMKHGDLRAGKDPAVALSCFSAHRLKQWAPGGQQSLNIQEMPVAEYEVILVRPPRVDVQIRSEEGEVWEQVLRFECEVLGNFYRIVPGHVEKGVVTPWQEVTPLVEEPPTPLPLDEEVEAGATGDSPLPREMLESTGPDARR